MKYGANYVPYIHCRDNLFEIEREILWLLEIQLFEFKVVSCLKLNLLNKNCVLWIVVGSKKLSGNIYLFMGYINTMFQNNMKRVVHQNKAHTKFSQGLQFCRPVYLIYFYLLIFLLSLLVKLRIISKDCLIHISYNRIHGIIRLRWVTWKTETTFCLDIPCLV